MSKKFSWQDVFSWITKVDLFAHQGFINYKKQQSHGTRIGTFFSVLIIFFLACLIGLHFFDKQPVNFQNVGWNTYDESDPSNQNMTISPQAKNMFAIGLTGINLNSITNRPFDISLRQVNTDPNGQNFSIPLYPCNYQDWQQVSQTIGNKFNQLNMQQWLCSPNNTIFQLSGTYTSQTFKFAEIVVEKCDPNNPFYPGGSCLSKAQIDNYVKKNGKFVFNFYYINPRIKLNQERYLEHYLQDKNFFYFSPDNGVTANLFYEKYEIISKENVFPLNSKYNIQSGFVTSQPAIFQNYQVTNTSNTYVKLHLRTNYHKETYVKVEKAKDEIFSYAGGIFIIVYLFLCFLKSYSKDSFLLEMGSKIFKLNNHQPNDHAKDPKDKKEENQPEEEPLSSDDYNFWQWIWQWLACISSQYKECQEECLEQLNLEYLFERINLMEKSIKVLLEKKQRELLHLVQKPTIYQIKSQREIMTKASQGNRQKQIRKLVRSDSSEEMKEKKEELVKEIEKEDKKIKEKQNKGKEKEVEFPEMEKIEIIPREANGPHTFLPFKQKESLSANNLLSNSSEENSRCAYQRKINKRVVAEIRKKQADIYSERELLDFLEENNSPSTQEEVEEIRIREAEISPEHDKIIVRPFEEGEIDGESQQNLPVREEASYS